MTPSLTYRAPKRLLDVVLSGTALLVISPLLLTLIVMVKFEHREAPALFRQARTGRGGRRFTLYKLRTMVPNAEHLYEEMRKHSVVSWPDFRVPDDPRVTKLGRFLRRTSIDELPQLFNVLRGDMTLVGPRPTSFEPTTYDTWQTERLRFRPGLTGPWQVHGRTTMDFTERCRLEITFFRNPSLWRELRLLFATVGVVVRRTGVA